MKKIYILLFLGFTLGHLTAQNYRSNCPVKEETFTRSNPDGSSISMHVFGTEMLTYFETLTGYTLIENANGYMEYATLDAQGNMVGSGQIVRNNEIPLFKDLKPHIRYSSEQIGKISANFFKENQVNGKKAGGKPFPPKGKRKVITLLIEYPDLRATIPKSNFDSMMVKTNYNGTGSFRDYYLKASFGQLELNTDVFGWYMASNSYLNYARSNANYIGNVGELVKRAILAADSAGVDFSQYDNDGDGYADGIVVMHAGIGAEEQSAPGANKHIWSHRFSLSNTVGGVLVDGVVVDSYGIFPEKRFNGGAYSQVGIGVLSHEFGHLLDLPDLYSTQSNGSGAGNFANMAGGPWLNSEKTPCMHDAWTRIAMGWVEPTVINASGIYTIPKSLVDSNFTFKINTSAANEYFLLENRQRKGFDMFIPGRGLAIWHVNTTRARLLSVSSSNNVNNDTSAYGMGLEQADGRNDLEKNSNRGDNGDLYPGSTLNRFFNDYTKPSAVLHQRIGGVKQKSNIVISNITQNPDSSITFTVGNQATAGFEPVPATGCAPLQVNFTNQSSFATNYLWVFEDGSSTSQLNTNKTFETPGNYQVKLIVLDSAGNRLDSNIQTIQVFASPKSVMQVTRLDSNSFELKNKSEGALYAMWRFGSNQSSNAPELIYTIPGNTDVPVRLIAYSSNQCVDTASGILSFWPLGNEGLMKNAGEILAYPNPFTDNLSIWFQQDKSQSCDIKIISSNGQVVYEKKGHKIEAGKSYFELPSTQFSAGIYLLEVSGENFKKIVRILKRGS
ncbi:MAG: M6 family metalloprotease domain-containing protein [Bacteroidia bacterium]|nr:M6 family metalloprotease domain-containing protein [Bacteroidia bacterium]